MWKQANSIRTRIPLKTPSPQYEASVIHRSSMPEDIGDDLLMGSREAVRQSWILLREALVEGKTQKIGAFLSLHTRAIEARVKAEAMVREEMERNKILIPLTEAQAMARKGFEIILQRLQALPMNIGPRANPSAPEHATDILQSEITSIIADAQQAFMNNE